MSAVELTEAEREAIHDALRPYDAEGFAPVVHASVEAILAARIAAVIEEVADGRILRLAYRYEQERDEARANRDRLAHDNAALRRQVADLTAERDRETERADHLVAWKDMGFRDRDRWQGRAEAAERALARVRALADDACHHCGSAPDSDGDHSCPCPNTDSECLEHTLRPVMPDGLRAALDGPAPQPDEAEGGE